MPSFKDLERMHDQAMAMDSDARELMAAVAEATGNQRAAAMLNKWQDCTTLGELDLAKYAKLIGL